MSTKPVVLIVDDELGVRESVRMVLKESFEPTTAASGEEALAWLEENSADLIFLDILMPGIDGLEALERIRARDPLTAVVMLTATKTVKTAVSAMKLGAFDYLTKPFDIDELRIVAKRATENASLRREVEDLRDRVGQRYRFENIIGSSEPMKKIFDTVSAVSRLKTTVLITGESGTGKELIARAVHHNSPRAEARLVTLNCAAIPESLLESELFGHEKGSFTDATERKIGQFERADHGTIFLDEIGEMSAALQAKLLRVLEAGEIQRVGGGETIKVDVRVVAATNRNLLTEVDAGRFRKDLYYRLNVVSVEMPALRKRREDIPLLIHHFLASKSRELGLDPRPMSPGAIERLSAHSWPGNVRELENTIERLLVLATGDGAIEHQALPADFEASVPASATGPASGLNTDAILNGRFTLSQAVDEFERDVIAEALNQTLFNQTRAAEMLGTTRRILKYRMDKLGLQTPEA